MPIESSLQIIESFEEQLGRTALLRSFRHGLEHDYTRSRLRAVGLEVPEDLLALYAWHDGSTTDGIARSGDIHVFPGFYFLSLEDAIANYEAFAADDRWSPSWFPLFTNGGGDFYVLDLAEANNPCIRHFRIDESEHPVEYERLRDMIDTVAAAFDRGIIHVDDDGYLDMNYEAFDELAAEMNPAVAWWSE